MNTTKNIDQEISWFKEQIVINREAGIVDEMQILFFLLSNNVNSSPKIKKIKFKELNTISGKYILIEGQPYSSRGGIYKMPKPKDTLIPWLTQRN